MGKLDELWNKVSFGTQKDVIIAVLEDEIEIHKSRLQPAGSGTIHTTISGIEQRIKELKQ
jgi:hypothetical protein|tara:strand:+ start:628 stop:807 length:180 start_codon:yes stop_codon:yes gene_type:complete